MMRELLVSLILASVFIPTAVRADMGVDPMGKAAGDYSTCLDDKSTQFDDGGMQVSQLIEMADAACRGERLLLRKRAFWQSADAQLFDREALKAYLLDRQREAEATLLALRDLQMRKIYYHRATK